MPELPEVETTRRSFAERIEGATVRAVRLGKPLRWPLGCDPASLQGRRVGRATRRGKYLWLPLDAGGLLLHLGMSGSLAFGEGAVPPGAHDHFDLVTDRGMLRLTDPRRFGAVVWSSAIDQPPAATLLGGLGLEGLGLEGLGLEGLGLDIDKDASPLRTDPAASKQTWQDRAVEQAQELDIRGFRVTRLPSITAMGSATVSVSFFARMPDNEYRIVWSDEVTTDPATVSPEDIKRVAQDPQVQQIMKFADALSVGQNANEALRFGAAVQLNLNEANTHFLEFIQRHTRSLDGSMIVIPSH